MVADGKSIDIINRMYQKACEKYQKDNPRGNPSIIFLKEFELACNVQDVDELEIIADNNVIVYGCVSCFFCMAKKDGDIVATAFLGLGEYG